MRELFQKLQCSPLFAGIGPDEIASVLTCLGAREEQFAKNTYLLRAGDAPDSVGLLLSGSALIVQEDFWGNRNILAKISPPEAFAEAFACSPGAVLHAAVCAEEDCTVLWLAVNRILTTCPSACAHHSRMVRNLLSELAGKNLRLSEKLRHMGQRTTREKVLSFLSAEAQRQRCRDFTIAFNRQQLADYLSVERSALSAELSRLRRDGVIEFEKNRFLLK